MEQLWSIWTLFHSLFHSFPQKKLQEWFHREYGLCSVVLHGDSMDRPWRYYGLPWTFLITFHSKFPQFALWNVLWKQHGNTMEVPWKSVLRRVHRKTMEVPWKCYGEVPQKYYGCSMEVLWSFHGSPLEVPWKRGQNLVPEKKKKKAKAK